MRRLLLARFVLPLALLFGQIGAHAHALTHLDEAEHGSERQHEAQHQPCGLCAAYAGAAAPPSSQAFPTPAEAVGAGARSPVVHTVRHRAPRAHRPRGPPARF